MSRRSEGEDPCTGKRNEGYYRMPDTIDLSHEGPCNMIKAKKRLCMRHETCNKQFKNGAWVAQDFRNGISLQYVCNHSSNSIYEPLFDNAFIQHLKHLK